MPAPLRWAGVVMCLAAIGMAGCTSESLSQPGSGIAAYRYVNRTEDTVLLEGFYTRKTDNRPVALSRRQRIAPGEVFTERKDDPERDAPLLNRCEYVRLEFGGEKEIWYFRWEGIWKTGNPFLTDHYVPEPAAGGTSYRYEITPQLAATARAMRAVRSRDDPYAGEYGRLPGTLRLATYNVRTCRPTDKVLGADYQRTAEVIDAIRPDAAAIQELDSMTSRHARYQLGELARRTGLAATFGSTFDYLGGRFGNGILSAERPRKVDNIAFADPEAGFNWVEPRKFLVADFDRFVLIATHFDHSETDYNILGAQRINEWVSRNLTRCTKPVFLAGDFNEADLQAAPMRVLSTMWEIISPLRQPTYIGEGKSLCIDYIMRWRGNGAPVRIAGAAVPQYDGIAMRGASDHLPVIVDIETGPLS